MATLQPLEADGWRLVSAVGFGPGNSKLVLICARPKLLPPAAAAVAPAPQPVQTPPAEALVNGRDTLRESALKQLSRLASDQEFQQALISRDFSIYGPAVTRLRNLRIEANLPVN